jgi:hypothetical protein
VELVDRAEAAGLVERTPDARPVDAAASQKILEDPGFTEDPGDHDPPALKGLSQRLT